MPLLRRSRRLSTVSHRTNRSIDVLVRGAATALLALGLGACADVTTAPVPEPLAPSGPDQTVTGASITEIFVTTGESPEYGDARAINNAGQATGASIRQTGPTDYRPYRWTPGAGTVRLTGVFGGTAYGNDINDAGVIVGAGVVNFNDGLRAFRGTGTTMVNLGMLPGAGNEGNVRAWAINASGQVVGESKVDGNFGPGVSHAVLWSPSNVIQDLGTLGGNQSSAKDINASGQVIGTSTLAGDAVTHFFIWSAGTGMQDLTTQLGALTSVIAINDAGQIAGDYTTASGATHAFLYTPGSGLKDLGTLGGASSKATGLNNNGQVVGASTTADGATHAFLWTPSDGMEDVTAITGVPDVRRLNDNLQTLSGGNGQFFAGRDVKLVQLQVASNAAPVARFTWSCDGLTCTIDGSMSSDDKGIVSYDWDLNKYPDPLASGAKTTVTYPHDGNRNVKLTVRDASGLTHSVTQTLPIGSGSPGNQPPVAQFTSACTNLACTFDAGSSTDDVGIVNRSWSFGDGSTAGNEAKPGHTYAAPGTYTVTLTVTDGGGLTSTVTKQRIVTSQPSSVPVAAFTWSCDGLTCILDASSSSDDEAIRTWDWNLDKYPDGSASGYSKLTVTYPHSGTRNVTLTVRDEDGNSNSVTKQLTISDAPPPPPVDAAPVARFTWSCPTLTCSFDATTSSDDNGIVSYSWDMNKYPDPYTTGATPTVLYPHTSTRNVTLTVTDAKGQTNSVTQQITVP